MLGYAANYLMLGNGGIERRMIFDTPPLRWAEVVEGAAIAGLLAIAAYVAWTRAREDAGARAGGVALLCYTTIGVALPLLPHGTAEHHWIIGTPFQYLAIALAAGSLYSRSAPSPRGRALFAACLSLVIVARAPVIVSAFEGVRHDEYSRIWDPSLNEAAAFVARQPSSAVFVAASWGTATQALCFANGRPNFVFEPYVAYGGPDGPQTMSAIIDPPERRLVIAAALRPAAPLRPGEINTLRRVTAAIFDDLASRPGWAEVRVDPPVAGLRAVEIRMFRRTRLVISDRADGPQPSSARSR